MAQVLESTQYSPPPVNSPVELVRSSVRFLLFAFTILAYWLDYRLRVSRKPNLSQRARAAWMTQVANHVRRVLGLRLMVHGHPPDGGLIIANHLSYLDIVVLNAVTRCLFVSKVEIADYPIFGDVARWAGVVFIDRKKRSDVADVAVQMRRLLAEGVPLVLFPEGTTSAGETVLPFKASLFAPVIEAGCPVTPCAIDYSLPGGSVRDEICYWGDDVIGPHLFHLLGKTGIGVSLTFGQPIVPTGDRKELARELHTQLVELRARNVQS